MVLSVSWAATARDAAPSIMLVVVPMSSALAIISALMTTVAFSRVRG